ncbi:hypothetical protein J6590_017616 [Homalodisca vitripennis]|nr:hypothetical protein J6590_017616 [Homalodisca vitripennis]
MHGRESQLQQQHGSAGSLAEKWATSWHAGPISTAWAQPAPYRHDCVPLVHSSPQLCKQLTDAVSEWHHCWETRGPDGKGKEGENSPKFDTKSVSLGDAYFSVIFPWASVMSIVHTLYFPHL